MNRFFLLVCFTLLSMQESLVFAQTVNKLNKQNKEFIKQYKKTHDLEDMSAEIASDGYWYYVVLGKDLKCGIVNNEGKEIVPPKYKYPIGYYPAIKADDSRHYNAQGSRGQGSDALFSAYYEDGKGNRHYTFYKTDGTILKDDFIVKEIYSFKRGYFDVTVYDEESGRELDGLYTWGLEEVLPAKYDIIETDGVICKYRKKIGEINGNGNWMMGAMSLDGSLPVVPCQFRDVQLDSLKNGWLVKDFESYIFKPYNPNKHYTTDMKDEGIELYWKEQYEDVIIYYSKAGVEKPWAKFYTGSSMLEMADDKYYTIKKFIDVAKEGKMDMTSNGMTNRQRYMNLRPEFELIKQLYATGYSMLDAYLVQDSIFASEAKEKMSISLDWRLERVDQTKSDFVSYWNEYQQQNVAIAVRQEEIKKQRQEFRSAITMALITGFINGLNNAMPETNKHTNRVTGAVADGGSVMVSGNSSGTYNASNVTSTTSTATRKVDHTRIAEWRNRRANAERMIQEYQQQLIKNPNDASIKSMIRSQENIIRNCDEQIMRLERGQ